MYFDLTKRSQEEVISSIEDIEREATPDVIAKNKTLAFFIR